jgi:hypothetical protein
MRKKLIELIAQTPDSDDDVEKSLDHVTFEGADIEDIQPNEHDEHSGDENNEEHDESYEQQELLVEEQQEEQEEEQVEEQEEELLEDEDEEMQLEILDDESAAPTTPGRVSRSPDHCCSIRLI